MIGKAARAHRGAVVIRPDVAPGRRVLAVSDIHGNLPFLKGLLDKAAFSPADVLVLVGDLFEKGEDSLGVLRYVMGLMQTHTVYPLCGNCDHIDRQFLEGGPGVDEALWPILRFWGARFLPFQLAAQLGLALPRSIGELPALRRAVREGFPGECAFLLGMPHILEAGRFLFVHGGVPREDRLEGLDAYGCMKFDDFLGQGLSFGKWVVVGHWPVTLYHEHYPCDAPLILPGRRIISIDGGCVLKVDGQLNALIIPDVNGGAADYTAYDGLPRVRALDAQEPSGNSINIRWSDSRVEVLREEGDSAWCRHLSSGRELWLPKQYLVVRPTDGLLHTQDTTDYRLPVEPGETLGLCASCCKGRLVKKANGVSGWYYGRIEPVS